MSSAELRHEHQTIRGVLVVLEQHIAAASQSGIVPAEFFRDLVEFSRQFIDRCHHGKEEGCLFPCLVQRGMTPEESLLTVLLEEHAAGRDLIRRISGALDRYEQGNAAAAEVLDPSRAYADLLREHIRKEDDLLFPMGDGLLTAADHEATGRCYADRETALGAGEHHRFVHLAYRLMEGDASR